MENSIEQIVANVAGKTRRETHNGRDYIVAPLSLIVPGVLNGSKGPLFYPEEEVSRNPSIWDWVPITVYHPIRNGQPISGRDPSVWEEQGIGHVRNPSYDQKLRGEGWFDVERTTAYDNKLPEQHRILPRLQLGQPIELSTGLYTRNEEVQNGSYRGRGYTHVARDYYPDHLAILPDMPGACSNKDGCGVLVNSNPEGCNQFTGPSCSGSSPPTKGERAAQITTMHELGKKYAKAIGEKWPKEGRNRDSLISQMLKWAEKDRHKVPEAKAFHEQAVQYQWVDRVDNTEEDRGTMSALHDAWHKVLSLMGFSKPIPIPTPVVNKLPPIYTIDDWVQNEFASDEQRRAFFGHFGSEYEKTGRDGGGVSTKGWIAQTPTSKIHLEHTGRPGVEPHTRRIGPRDERGGGGVTGAATGVGGPVAGASSQSVDATASQGGSGGSKPSDTGSSKSVPASLHEVNNRLDKYQKFFESRGQHQVSEWLGKLRDHVGKVGAEEALKQLGSHETTRHAGQEGKDVQYWGVGTEEANWRNMGHFIESYLSRNGIRTVTGDNSDWKSPVISALGKPDRYVKGDFKPASDAFRNKLEESKHLPGLEKSEDVSKLLGKSVTHLTPEVTDKLDTHYGKGQWIVKAYGDDAAAGFGIFFPQRAAAIKQDAQNTIWHAGEQVAKHGFEIHRDESGKAIGLKHKDGEVYHFGSEKYDKTIHGIVREHGDKAAGASHSEQGAILPNGGKEFMVQPAFKAVGISDAERAAGKTWHATNEGRVHLHTKEDGTVSVIPHATWLKGGNLPVVFHNEDTRAMEKAAHEAVSKLPESARKGQIYAPDVMKTADGYRVVELNAQGDNNGSGYLHDNHFTIDAFTSHITGKTPLHVQFIRKLLTSKKGATAGREPVGNSKELSINLGRGNWSLTKRGEHANTLSDLADKASEKATDDDPETHKTAQGSHTNAGRAHRAAADEAAKGSSTKAEKDYQAAGYHANKASYHFDKADEHGKKCEPTVTNQDSEDTLNPFDLLTNAELGSNARFGSDYERWNAFERMDAVGQMSLNDFQSDDQRRAFYNLTGNFNPHHDDKGRFTDESGSTVSMKGWVPQSHTGRRGSKDESDQIVLPNDHNETRGNLSHTGRRGSRDESDQVVLPNEHGEVRGSQSHTGRTTGSHTGRHGARDESDQVVLPNEHGETPGSQSHTGRSGPTQAPVKAVPPPQTASPSPIPTSKGGKAVSTKPDQLKGASEKSAAAVKASALAKKQGSGNVAKKQRAHDRAAEAHEQASYVHAELGNHTAAEEHMKAALEHASKGTKATHNRLVEIEVQNMDRNRVINFLTTNCSCWNKPGDADLLAVMPDEKIRHFYGQTRNAMMEAPVMPNKKRIPPEDPDALEEEAEPSGTSADNDVPEQLRQAEMARGRRPAPAMNHEGQHMTDEQWMNQAPPRIRSAVQNAMNIEQRERTFLINRLTGHLPEGDVKKRLLTRYATKDLSELSDILAGMPSVPVGNSFNPIPTNNQGNGGMGSGEDEPMPLFMGFGGNNPTANGYGQSNGREVLTANEANEDLLELPTINWQEVRDEQRGLKRA